MARTGTSDTLASHVYEQLRAAILAGEHAPGERLMPAELRGRFGVSISVIREALSRLAEQRIVKSVYNHGFQVTPLSRKDLVDLTDLRVEVEGYALRRAIAKGDIAWESQVVAAHHTLAATPPRSAEQPDRTSDAWAQAHRAFHQTLIAACDMPILLDFCGSLFDASELYRRLSVPVAAGRRDVPREHREIMEATLARDTDLATRRLEAHFRKTTSLVLKLLPAEDGAGDT
ncbi:GntR family transcriptional regulator [Amycolatopsis pithecellobii]|uniref:FCD domain-containing protein n=1 Tax=Amycolatopsis pithecellobii TaxID=664692 RepID=A0A6N7ZBJ2_9PSEU|nr:GntR family transcriptional regulator [Amycolatopsis pithecellobii]MTD59132.1 FCD domain-containing protein [Amycolatopsis pithecellobii]